jgi:hypothetical protein
MIVRVLSLVLLVAAITSQWVLEHSAYQKLQRTFQVNSPRCLFCNAAAMHSEQFYSQWDFNQKAPSTHHFCQSHRPKSEVVFYIWPEVDKYVLMVFSLILLLMGMFLAVAGAITGCGESLLYAFGSIVFSLLINNLLTWLLV